MVAFTDIIIWTLNLGLSYTAQKYLNRVNDWSVSQNILKLHYRMLTGTTSSVTSRNEQRIIQCYLVFKSIVVLIFNCWFVLCICFLFAGIYLSPLAVWVEYKLNEWTNKQTQINKLIVVTLDALNYLEPQYLSTNYSHYKPIKGNLLWRPCFASLFLPFQRCHG